MTINMNNVWLGIGLSILAGLSTGIGSILAFFTKKQDKAFLSGILGFSAGVMLYLSMIEIFGEARNYLEIAHGVNKGYVMTVVFFFWGVFLALVIDKFIPDMNQEKISNHKLLRTGLFLAITVAIHNFPEGIATLIGTIYNPALGINIAIAIMIHNIPEGIAVSIPIYFATGSKKKAFLYSFLSGLSEPLGAIVGYFFFMQFLTDTIFGLVLAGVAGIMVYISLDELLPTALKYGYHNITIYGLISGMIVMVLSLFFFNV